MYERDLPAGERFIKTGGGSGRRSLGKAGAAAPSGPAGSTSWAIS